MGLDAYLYYQCPYRPNGDVGQLQEMQRLVIMLRTMDQHGVPSVTFQLMGPRGVEERTVTRAEAEAGASAWEQLGATCQRCPVSNRRVTPGCVARIDYPFDEVALAVVREAMEIDAADFASPTDRFVRSLVAAGNCDGSRMERVLGGLQRTPAAVGRSPVRFVVDGRPVDITPYMVLEHLCFRSFLDAAATLEVREWYRCLYTAIGNRIVDGPDDQDTNTQNLFGSSPTLQQLAALGALVKQAEAHGLGMMLDG